MRLLSAELEYFCQHRYTHVEFVPGLNVIIGKNGSGKSNLIKGIYSAITGDFGRNDGVKTENISQFAKLTDTSRVVVALEHDGAILTIQRGLRPSTTRLDISAGGVTTTYTKTTEVNEALINILGVSGRLLSDYVFVDQWSIFDFLSMLPSERAKALQRLFRTEQADALWKLLGDRYDKIIIPTPGVDRDVVLARLSKTCDIFDGINVQLSALTEADCDPIRDKRLIDDWKAKATLEAEIRLLYARAIELEQERGVCARKMRELCKERTALKIYLEEEKEAYAEACRLVSHWDSFESVRKTRTMLINQKSNVQSTLSSLCQPVCPPNFISLDPRETEARKWLDARAKLISEVISAEYFMAQLISEAQQCPICGTPRADFAAHRSKYEAVIKEKRVVMAEGEARMEVSDVYRAALHKYHAQLKSANEQLALIDSQLSQLADISEPAKARSELALFIEQYDQVKQGYDHVVSELATIQRDHDNLETRHRIAFDTAGEKEKAADTYIVTEQEASDAAVRLLNANDYLLKKMSLEARRSILEEQIEDDRATLVKLEEIRHNAVATQAWADHVDAMRHILHRDGLSRIVAQNNLEAMQDEINELLDRFDSPFSVAADAGLSFVARFRDGRTVPAGRLSGGEKVLLALAFRVVVNAMFATDLGLLCLDEPTAGLDEGNLNCMRTALERLKELSTARGLQVIMITHERNLPCFDKVIDLG